MLPNCELPRSPVSWRNWTRALPCAISIHRPSLVWSAYIGESSGIHDVPDAFRAGGIACSPSSMCMCCMSCAGRALDWAAAGTLAVHADRMTSGTIGVRTDAITVGCSQLAIGGGTFRDDA